jgi:hypothetical protein
MCGEAFSIDIIIIMILQYDTIYIIISKYKKMWGFFTVWEALFTHLQNIMDLLFILNNLFWFSKSYFRQLGLN